MPSSGQAALVVFAGLFYMMSDGSLSKNNEARREMLSHQPPASAGWSILSQTIRTSAILLQHTDSRLTRQLKNNDFPESSLVPRLSLASIGPFLHVDASPPIVTPRKDLLKRRVAVRSRRHGDTSTLTSSAQADLKPSSNEDASHLFSYRSNH